MPSPNKQGSCCFLNPEGHEMVPEPSASDEDTRAHTQHGTLRCSHLGVGPVTPQRSLPAPQDLAGLCSLVPCLSLRSQKEIFTRGSRGPVSRPPLGLLG